MLGKTAAVFKDKHKVTLRRERKIKIYYLRTMYFQASGVLFKLLLLEPFNLDLSKFFLLMYYLIFALRSLFLCSPALVLVE